MTSTPSRSGSSPGLLIAGAFAVVLGGIGTGAAYFLTPRGERVGAIDLAAPAPAALTVNLAARSTLSFRLDATLPSPSSESSSRAKRNAVYDTLGESRLVLTATREGGARRTARCAAYEGRFVSASDTESEVAVSGIPLSCAFADADPGRYAITAEVTWARGVTARRASLEVRAAPR
ncbi:MAG: hypothetical protein Q8S73_00430 [Deltaproteobacteria bacterium]|nr:hypothetical protein [Myxococcales bacterium]MDP3212538.1 hypothetical protein [Deltaproteobacteria bacterium]